MIPPFFLTLHLLCFWAETTKIRVETRRLCLFLPYSSAIREGSSVRVRCRVAYDGAGFNGFQYQSGERRTVQGEIEQVLTRRYNRLIRVVGAGRTDAGVHARGQVVHFDLEVDDFNEPLDSYLRRLERSMNSMLTNDIRVWNLSPTPPASMKPSPISGEMIQYAWHAIYDAQKKLYSYRISTSPVMDPLQRHNRWHIDDGQKVDFIRLQEILQHYQGTHDFRAFGSDLMDELGSVSPNINTVRTVFCVDLVRDRGEGNCRIDVLLKGALYKMVRNMVGTALDVCRGRLSEKAFFQLLGPRLNKPDNCGVAITRSENPCKPAPPQGLTLEMVYYDKDSF